MPAGKKSSQTYKVNTNRRDVALGVCVIGESEQETGLSNTRVSDQEELEQVVVSMLVKVMSDRGIWSVVADTS